MLIVLPISKSDAHLAGSLAKVFKALGGLRDFEALVVTHSDCLNEAEELLSALDCFKDGKMYVYHTHFPTGWPQGCNAYFRETAFQLERMRNDKPWFWFELDNTPLVPGWAQKLWDEYRDSGKPFMGARVPTTRKMSDGTIFVDGMHMMGSGIYPPNLTEHCKLLKYASVEPWDCFCQHEIEPHMHATTQIQHNWSSCNYRRIGATGGVIRCDYRTLPTHPTLNYVRKDAVLVHGCKDDSLREVVLEKYR